MSLATLCAVASVALFWGHTCRGRARGRGHGLGRCGPQAQAGGGEAADRCLQGCTGPEAGRCQEAAGAGRAGDEMPTAPFHPALPASLVPSPRAGRAGTQVCCAVRGSAVSEAHRPSPYEAAPPFGAEGRIPVTAPGARPVPVPARLRAPMGWHRGPGRWPCMRPSPGLPGPRGAGVIIRQPSPRVSPPPTVLCFPKCIYLKFRDQRVEERKKHTQNKAGY